MAIGDGDRLSTLRAQPAGADPLTKHVTVGATLVAKVARLTGRTLVDGCLTPRAMWRNHQRAASGGVTTTKQSLAASRRAHFLAAAGDEAATPTDWAEYRHAIVTRRVGA